MQHEGTIAKLITRLDPKLCGKFIWKNKQGRPMLYMKLKKAFLRDYTSRATILEAIIRYTFLWGFKLTEYNIFC